MYIILIKKVNNILELIILNKLSPGHAKILVGLENASFVAKKIIQKKLSVRQSESLVRIFKTNKISKIQI